MGIEELVWEYLMMWIIVERIPMRDDDSNGGNDR